MKLAENAAAQIILNEFRGFAATDWKSNKSLYISCLCVAEGEELGSNTLRCRRKLKRKRRHPNLEANAAMAFVKIQVTA